MLRLLFAALRSLLDSIRSCNRKFSLSRFLHYDTTIRLHKIKPTDRISGKINYYRYT